MVCKPSKVRRLSYSPCRVGGSTREAEKRCERWNSPPQTVSRVALGSPAFISGRECSCPSCPAHTKNTKHTELEPKSSLVHLQPSQIPFFPPYLQAQLPHTASDGRGRPGGPLIPPLSLQDWGSALGSKTQTQQLKEGSTAPALCSTPRPKPAQLGSGQRGPAWGVALQGEGEKPHCLETQVELLFLEA